MLARNDVEGTTDTCGVQLDARSTTAGALLCRVAVILEDDDITSVEVDVRHIENLNADDIAALIIADRCTC